MSFNLNDARQVYNEYQRIKRNERLSRMTPEELAGFRKKEVIRVQEYRKRKKSEINRKSYEEM